MQFLGDTLRVPHPGDGPGRVDSGERAGRVILARVGAAPSPSGALANHESWLVDYCYKYLYSIVSIDDTLCIDMLYIYIYICMKYLYGQYINTIAIG